MRTPGLLACICGALWAFTASSSTPDRKVAQTTYDPRDAGLGTGTLDDTGTGGSGGTTGTGGMGGTGTGGSGGSGMTGGGTGSTYDRYDAGVPLVFDGGGMTLR